MDPDKIEKPDLMDDNSDLLQASRLPALQASNEADLRRLIGMLDIACDTARMAAIRNVPGPLRQVEADDSIDRNCGFATLFDALRRARAEARRRGTAPPGSAAMAFRKRRELAHAERPSDDQSWMPKPKARG